ATGGTAGLWVWTVRPFRGYLLGAVVEPAGGFGVPGSRSDFLARVAQTGPRLASGRCCLAGLVVTPARRSQADAARAAVPPYAARAAQPPTLAVIARQCLGSADADESAPSDA